MRGGSGIGLDVCSSTAPNEWGSWVEGRTGQGRAGKVGQDREARPGRVLGVGLGVEQSVEQGSPGIELSSQQGAETAMPLALAGPQLM